jgi:hypothetical protein
MRTPGSLRSWALAGALLLSASVARAEDAPRPYAACDRTPTEGDTAAAKGAFQAGNASFNEADYDRAITYWEDAYRRDCTAHPLLLNLARAYELDGQKRHAVNALETFRTRSPGSAEDAQIKRRIEKLQEQIAAESATAAPPPPGPAPAAVPPPPAPGQPEPEAPAADTGSGGSRPIWPLFIAGGGAVLGIVGGVIWAGGASDVSEFEEKCGPKRQCPTEAMKEDANDARTKSTVGAVVTFVGAGALVGGLVLYFVQPTTSTTAAMHGPETAIVPEVAPGYGGLSLSGRF